MKRFIQIIFMICFASSLWGCGIEMAGSPEPEAQQVSGDMRNVEERDYATILIIEKNDEDESGERDIDDKLDDMLGGLDKPYHFILGIAQEKRVGEKSMNEAVSEWECETLTELSRVYQEEKGKDLSLAHLKVIFLVPEDERYTQDTYLLEMLEQDVEIAKTVPMLLLEDEDDFLDYLKDEKEPVGNYVENIINVKKREGSNVSTVADYLKAWREGTQIKPDWFTEAKEGYQVQSLNEKHQ